MSHQQVRREGNTLTKSISGPISVIFGRHLSSGIADEYPQVDIVNDKLLLEGREDEAIELVRFEPAHTAGGRSDHSHGGSNAAVSAHTRLSRRLWTKQENKNKNHDERKMLKNGHGDLRMKREEERACPIISVQAEIAVLFIFLVQSLTSV